MPILESSSPDLMQVCRNGHVITDRLLTNPEKGLSHCDRCGARTLDCCPTCGYELTVHHLPGLVPVGRSQAPLYCSACGVSFPWAQAAASRSPGSSGVLQPFLKRLPSVIRQLRDRHGNRPPFRVADTYDLEDLVRSLLPLNFDDVRPECRTPSYASGVRTDFLVEADVALLIKHATPEMRERQLAEQIREDREYYIRQRRGRLLIPFIYDPERFLPNSQALETAWSNPEGDVTVQCVIAS